MSDDQLRSKLARVEELVHEAEKFPDERLRSQVQELVQNLLDFHGIGLARMVDQVRQLGDAGSGLLRSWTRDELTSSLLLLYGLHPVDLETRVREALDGLNSELHAQGVEVQLAGIDDGVVRLRTAAGPLGIAATVGTILSGKTGYNGTAAPGTYVKYQGLSILDLGLQVTFGGLAVGGHMIYGHTVGQWSNLEPAGGREAFAPLIGASYTMGSNIIGFHFFDYQSAGNWTRLVGPYVGRSMSEEGLAIGDTFTVAPGAYLMLSYLYGTRHQTGVDLLSGTVSSATNFVKTNNNTRAQGIWAGTMFRW